MVDDIKEGKEEEFEFDMDLANVIAGELLGLEGNRRDCNTIEKQCSRR
jgi:hypothetical protein